MRNAEPYEVGMNQRSTFSRSKEPRREKFARSKREEDEQEETPARRSSSERYSAFYSRYASEKPRSTSRDSQGNLIFRRQERAKVQDTAKGDGGRLGYNPHYNRSVSSRDRDYASKRYGHYDNSHVIDENRLINTLHRLLRDEDRERQANVVRQLKLQFSHPDNLKVIQSNREEIISTFEDFIQLGLNSELKQELVLTIGTLGAVLGMKAKSLLEWEFSVYNMSKSDDIRVLILKSVNEMLKIDKEKGNLAELVPFVMAKLQSALEIADVPDLLVAIVTVIFEISNTYPLIFSKHFSDTVDILIGWHIDATQQQSVIEFTSNTLIGFHQFWISDINFTVTLLGQFLEDMESYAEELAQSKLNSSSSTESQPCSPEENIAKIKSLIRVLITVLKSIENLITPDESGPVTWQFITEMLKNFLKYVRITVDYCYCCDLMTSANECVSLLLKLVQLHSKDVLDDLMCYIELLQGRGARFLSESHLISVLHVMTSFVKTLTTCLPVKFVHLMFSSDSLSRQLRFSPSSTVQKQLISLHHAVLAVKNVQIVEEFYKCIVIDIRDAHDVLFKSDECRSVGNRQAVKNAEASLFFDICTLVEIGNIKHSIIRMFALKPSFFDLIISHLKPTLPELAIRYPALQSAILYTLYSHSQRHYHFVNSSALINPYVASGSPLSTPGNNSPIMADVPPPSPSSANLGKVLKLLVTLLMAEETSFDSRLLAAEWAAEILDSVQTHLSRLARSSQFVELLKAVLDAGFINDSAICKASCKSVQVFVKCAVAVLDETTLQRCYELCILRMSHPDHNIQNSYALLLSLLPVDIIILGNSISISKANSPLSGIKDMEFGARSYASCSDVWALQRNYMSRSYAGNFFSHHFRSVINFVLHGKEPQERNWLLHLFYSCPPAERHSRVDALIHQRANSSSATLWFWALWEVAQLCVFSKLRTPIGKPQETFMALEGALKSCLKLHKTTDNFLGDSEHTLLRVNLLVSLMEYLEKLMYNAYEGCAVSLCSPPKNVRTFFRTNKSTCHEWLSRVRSTILFVALNAGCPAAAVRHGFELLQEFKNNGVAQGVELEHNLFALVKALIDLHCPEAIAGLYVWCKENFGKKFAWIKSAVDCASGRFENAATEHLSILQTISDNHIAEKQAKQLEELNKTHERLKNGTTVTAIENLFFSELNICESPANKPSIDPYLHAFLVNQVIDHYVNLGSWTEALKWAEMMEKIKFNQNGISTHSSGNINNTSYLRCLMCFDNAESIFTKDTSCAVLDLKNDLHSFSQSDWSVEEQFNKTQKYLLSCCVDAKIKSSDKIRDISGQANEASDEILQLLKVATLNWPPYIDAKHAALHASISSFSSPRKSPLLLRNDLKLDPSDCYSSTLGFLLTWENIWLTLNSNLSQAKSHDSYVNLLLAAARLARKQQNLKFCQRLIRKISDHLSLHASNGNFSLSIFEDGDGDSDASTLQSVLKKSLDCVPNEKLVKMQREGAKLLRCSGDIDGACVMLLNSVSAVSSHCKELSNPTSNSAERLCELSSRSILNLVKYLQHDPKVFNNLTSDYHQMLESKENNWHLLLHNTVNDLSKSGMNSAAGTPISFINELQKEEVVADPDYVIGQLLQLSIYQCPSLAKSWCSFASWCYTWGKKVVSTSSSGTINMLPEEKARLLSLMPNASKDEIEAVLSIVTNLHSSAGGEWDNQEMDYTENGAEETRLQLVTNCPFLLKLESCDVVIDDIVEVWKSLVARTYSYYRMAALAYLQYLQLNGKCSAKERSEDDNVTATLRLLRLVVKHASELRDVLEDGLADTPTAPWRGIIPQLFSRLNHPEPYVRKSISDLLCRVAQAAPHLIVFPAVVGSLTLKAGPKLQEETAGLFGAYLSDTPEEASDSPSSVSQTTSGQDDLPSTVPISLEEGPSEEDTQKTAIMQNCFAALVETLGSQDERTISEAKNLINELHRITLLWDELWLGTLNLHQNEVNRRFLNLEKEINKVLNNSYLNKEEKKEIIKEKHNIYVKPTLFLLEQLQMITSQPAETPHEQWFQRNFERQIENALNKMRNPAEPSKPQESWAVFKQLYQLLQQKVQQQSRSHLSMEYISPVLASLKNTVIPMPGTNKASGIITVQSVHNTVSILPTKTKPKKLAFVGSDGHRYTYLFKGLEDLHLDERIMQFLSIVNNMFSKNKKFGKEVYYARYYSVTPLGPRSGLIQWVDGATPLFGLYKRWQQRESNALALKAQSTTSGNIGTSTVLRPSEIYYNKLTPLLKEKGLNSLDNRKEWPLSVLLEVLKQLMEETPSDLLAKELWCACSSALEWWNVTQTYNHSTAVMSIIGYIIGLGDRHLDNVLVDLCTGEVVHIDYNVCFEKGKNLRVPEKVPFRLTPNIIGALGLTGVEGIFKTSCEHVLKVLRRGRETLLTLLEAFVYDPLVDWTPGSEGGYTGAVYGGRQAWATETKHTRQSMEVEIAMSMFAIRVAEMKGEWMKNRDDLLAAFPKLESLLEEWKNAQQELQQLESQLQEACQEKALLEEAQANPTHNLYTVPQRYEETAIVKSTIKAAKDALNEKLSECKKWHVVHCESLATVSGTELAKWCSEVSEDQNSDALSISPVVDFLQSAGQGQLVQQCEHAENELKNVLQQRRLTMRSCIELLTTYATIIRQFGPGYKEQNRCYKWQQWLNGLISEFTSIKCLEIIADFRNQYGRESPDAVPSSVSMCVQIQAATTEINTKILGVIDRMRLEGLENKSTLMTYMEETRCAVLCCLSEAGEQNHLAFLCVLGEALCTIRKQLFMMETAAGASGDRLVDLTSWNGDWFLDEIYSTCGNITQYVQLLLESQAVESAEMKAGLHGIKLAHFVFSALEDLSLNFQNIILPEAVQTAMEPSVMEMVAKLDRIIARCGFPLERLISELESNITNLILKMQVSENRVCDAVKKLRNEFESLMTRSEPHISDLNHGQMLLMGFNGLFTKVDSDLDVLMSFLDNQPIPAVWKKLDFFRDTVALAPALHHPASRLLLKDIYFVRKLLAMQQSFHICYSFAASLQVNPRAGLLERELLLISDHQLVKPLKQFTADYVRHMVLGLPSQAVGYALCLLVSHLGYDLATEIELRDVGVENKVSIEEISLKAFKSCITEHFLEAQIPPLSALLSTFDAAWRKEDLARRLDQSMVVLRGNLQRAQLHLARFQWYNEDLLIQGNFASLQNPSVPSRSSVMSEIRKAVSTLMALDCVVTASQERYLGLTAGIEQRLKWAAGANPSLVSLQEEFENAISDKTTAIANANQLSHDLVNVCNAVLHFEALRTRTTEAVSSDSTFMALINRCKEACELAESSQSYITPIEEHLLSMKPFPEKEGVTSEWLGSVIKKVSQSLSTCREKLEHQKSLTNVCRESLHLHVAHMHDLLSLHHKLMSEVRHILRNLAKHEQEELGTDFKSEGQVHRYMALYKEFSEHISSIVSKLLSEGQDLEATALANVESEIPALSVAASEVYNQLLELAGPLGARKHSAGEADRTKKQIGPSKKNLLPPLSETSAPLSPGGQRPKTPHRSGTPKKSLLPRDPLTGKVLQERNTYATNVWKRVKMKLDGRDPEPSKKSSISEQVDFVIKEATNLENLAVLYEGWTPWV